MISGAKLLDVDNCQTVKNLNSEKRQSNPAHCQAQADTFSKDLRKSSQKRPAGPLESPSSSRKLKATTKLAIGKSLDTRSAQAKLWEGIEKNDVDLIDMAMRSGADLNAKICDGGFFPIYYAANSSKKIDALKKILEYKPRLNVDSDEEFSVFNILISHENVEGTIALLDAGARIKEVPFWVSDAYQSAVHLAQFSPLNKQILEIIDKAHKPQSNG